jgi:hypothetical protein
MKEITFTKIVMIFISIVWLASLIACYFKPEINFIVDYTNGAFISGVVGYVVKSGTENFLKIKNNSTNS